MDPVPLKNYCEELESLEYNPIIGNKQSKSKPTSQIPTAIKPKINSASAVARSLSPGPRTPHRRPFSVTNLSPTESDKSAKMSKTDDRDLKEILAQMDKRQSEQISELKESLGERISNTEANISNKFDNLAGQISELRAKQDQEVGAREQLQLNMDNLQGQVVHMNDRMDQYVAPSVEEVAKAILPQVKTAFSAELKTHNNQVKATYFQSLVNELKLHEKDMMIYGYKPDGGPDLEAEIKQKLFKDKMDIDIDRFKAIFVGAGIRDKPKPIRVSFLSSEVRNNVLSQGFKLPKEVKIEKCMPRRYRNKNRDFKEYSWQLKEAANVKTRTVFKGHKLILEMKQHDDGPTKFDWTIVKEYYPEPESPTDRTEATRTREGLTASKTIEMVEKNVVIMSDLTITADKVSTVAYFQNVYMADEDRGWVKHTNADKANTKQILVVTLHNRQECFDFKAKYEKIDFNGKKPRISVFFGKD